MEGYWAPDIQACKDLGRYPTEHISHLCLLARNNQGLKDLWAMSSIAYDDAHFYHRPMADPDLLRQYGANLYASDGCIMTGLGRAIRVGDEDAARQYLGGLLDIFGERLYCELHTWQYMHPSDEDWVKWEGEPITTLAVNKMMTDLNQAKVRLATEMGIPMVVVNDAHHAYPEHWAFKEMVWGFKKEDNPDQQEGKGQKADHLMCAKEIHFWMERHGIARPVIDQAIRYSRELGEQCNAEIKPTLSLPRFTKSEADDFQLFLDKVEAGFRVKVEQAGLPREEYWRRMETEVSVIAQKRLAGYFLVVEDYVRAARDGTWAQYVYGGAKIPMLVGFGRGSAGGSLVSWLMGITSINPIKYGLLFERFLAPHRAGYPDIDIDFPRSKRKGVRDYVRKRWGEDRVCSICTMTRNQAKASVWDLGRALEITDSGDLGAIAKLVNEISKDDWEEEGGESADEDTKTWAEIMQENYKELSPWIAKYPTLFQNLNHLHGIIRSTNVHAAAVLISEEPFAGRIPTRVKKGTLMTQFDMYGVEELGGLKGDLLSLRHLDALEIAADLVKERCGVDIDYEAFTDEHYNDPAIWEQIDNGQTVGIFQLGTPGGTDAAMEFRPRSMVDVADLIAINRPGVRDAGLYNVYLRRRAGVEEVVYDHPLMENITKDTCGVLVYQEQLMQASVELAGFTAAESYDLNKAISKKVMEKVLAFKDKFVNGCLDNEEYTQGGTWDRKEAIAVAEKIWASIEASGRYCVTGDTRVKLSNGAEMTVADMYRRLIDDRRLEGHSCWYGCRFTGYQGKCQTCRVWRQKFKGSRGLKAWSLGDDGRLHPNRILAVYQNGVQPVWRVTLENGDSITATADHRHMTSTGWREVRDLSVGDELLVCGSYEPQVWEPEKTRTTAVDPAYAGARLPNSERCGIHSLGYRDGGYLALREWTEAQEWVCSEPGCARSRANGDRIERAHLDGNRLNNDPANLAMKCASHHKQHDYQVNGRRVRGEKGYPAIPTRIVSIEYAGEEMVYDLSMAVPHHSWVGNNIVTHNCFNKSHAVGYALISHAQIWMKHYYPAEMLVGFMMVDEANRNRYVRDARRIGLGILAPHVNLSRQNFTIEGNTIRYGVQAVRGIGEAGANALVAGQPYESLDDYLKRAKDGANKTACLALARLGALDCFGDRVEILKRIEYHRVTDKLAKSTLNDPAKLQKIVSERMEKNPGEWVVDIPNFANPMVVYEIEKELIGSFVTVDPMAPYLTVINAEGIRNPAAIKRANPGQQLVIGGQIIKFRKHKVGKGYQKGMDMAFMGVEWQGDIYDITVFPRAYEKHKYLFDLGKPVLCGCERLERGVSLVKMWRLDLKNDG